MSENTFDDNNIHKITVLGSLNFAISFVWVIIKGNRKKQSQEKMKSKRYQEKKGNITYQRMDIKFLLRYLPRPCMKQGCNDLYMLVIYLKTSI